MLNNQKVSEYQTIRIGELISLLHARIEGLVKQQRHHLLWKQCHLCGDFFLILGGGTTHDWNYHYVLSQWIWVWIHIHVQTGHIELCITHTHQLPYIGIILLLKSWCDFWGHEGINHSNDTSNIQSLFTPFTSRIIKLSKWLVTMLIECPRWVIPHTYI